MSRPQQIGIFRALQLGDMLCLVPALRALRHAHRDAHITLIGLPWAQDYARRFARYIDDFAVFPGAPGFPEQAVDEAAMPAFMAAMKEKRFDLLLQCHGSGLLSNPLLAGWGARRLAGFLPAGQAAPDPGSFIAWDEQRNEVLRFLDLLRHLGVPAQGEELELPLFSRDFDDLHSAAPALAPAGSYVCVHPGARYPSRRWPVDRFAAVAERAASQGLQVVLTGSQAESALCAELQAKIRVPVLNLAGRTTLGALAALVARARLVVCNDTGMSHVAAALATPSVVVSSGSNVQRWSPLDGRRHRVLFTQPDCRPCMHLECPYAGHPCSAGVTVEQVWRSAQAVLLAARGGGRSEPAAKENA